ncbi:MAG: hypothetical protein K5761_00090 [Clostridiales bacterium]|nr:hypothetical protein [Clostridiales bacterium]
MNDYVGKTCPYCRSTINEDDDIVICSICEMPHHKECWIANQGCTTFGCMGTINTPGSAPTSVTSGSMTYETEQTFCPACGTANKASSAYCMRCGHRLGTQNQTPVNNVYPPVAGNAYNPVSNNTYNYANTNVAQNNRPYYGQYGYQPQYQSYGYQQPYPNYGYQQPYPNYGYQPQYPNYGYQQQPNYGYQPQNQNYGNQQTYANSQTAQSATVGNAGTQAEQDQEDSEPEINIETIDE